MPTLENSRRRSWNIASIDLESRKLTILSRGGVGSCTPDWFQGDPGRDERAGAGRRLHDHHAGAEEDFMGWLRVVERRHGQIIHTDQFHVGIGGDDFPSYRSDSFRISDLLKPLVRAAIADLPDQAVGGFIVADGDHFIDLVFNGIGEANFILLCQVINGKHDKGLDEACGITHPVSLNIDHCFIL